MIFIDHVTFESKPKMAKQVREEDDDHLDDCIGAFTDGSPVEAEQLLSCIPQSGVKFVTTTFKFNGTMIALVSLLHLAAYWGWDNVVSALVSVYKCDADCKDEEGNIPLHYAAHNGRLEVVKYFLSELVCDPMSRTNNDGYTALHFACSNGHLNIAQYLIKETNCIASCENNNGFTPLHCACSYGHLNIAQYLIKETNCIASCENNNGLTPLHCACSNGHLDIARYLLREENCNPNCAESKIGGMPLHFACSNGHLDIAQYLIKETNCFASCENNDGRTPLHFACINGHLDITRYLIREENCNPSCETKFGDTPLHFACSNGHLNIVHYLIKETNCIASCENNDGRTPLHFACINGHLDITRYLIREENCNPSCETKFGDTPLHFACSNGHLNIVQYLIKETNCIASCENNDGRTPLHYACSNGHLDIARYLIREENCNPSCAESKFGNTPLHFACIKGHLNIAQYLIKETNCIASCENNDGRTPLHFACINGHLDITRYLIREENCNPSCAESKFGDTPLHFACIKGHLDIAQYLIKETNCIASCENNDGFTSLHYACIEGHLDIARYLIREENCNPSCAESKFGHTPLHFACIKGHLNIAQYLIKETNCIASCENNDGFTPLHHACSNGHLNIARYLIREENCNPSSENKFGGTPLLFACMNGHLNIAQYLIREENCDPSCSKSRTTWDTPLYYACMKNHTDIVKYLLSTGRVNPLTLSRQGQAGQKVCNSAVFAAMARDDVYDLFKPFQKYRKTFPFHKLILVGDSKAGKTTFAEQILSSSETKSVADVYQSTAGIILHHIQITSRSSVTENLYFVMYDFSGQQEYYSSHAAVLEQMMRKSRATFLCFVDLTKSKEEIGQSLNDWLSFIDNACSTAEGTSCLAIIGSHADQMASSEANDKLLKVLEVTGVKRVIRQHQYIGHFIVNCRYPDSASRRRFNDHLFKQKSIVASQPPIIYNTYAVNEFLHTELNVVGCSLSELVSIVADKNHYSLPSDESVLTEILTTLNDRGLILFIRHDESSWVVVDRKAFLNEIIGTIFAPIHSKVYCEDLASNTGIISVINLKKVFPKHNTEMLIKVLTSLDFCRPIDFSMLQYTNLQTTPSHSTDDIILFFPGLIQLERPDSLVKQGTLEFGWCLRCMDPSEFFTSRFLHVRLLTIAYEWPLVSHDPVKDLQCVVWRNGIFWRNSSITTVIELLENNRSVLVAMSCDDTTPVEHAKLRSSLIALVLRLQQQYCPHISVCEFLLSPTLVQRFTFLDKFSDSDLFDIRNVTRSFLLHEKGVHSKDFLSYLSVEVFSFEPYYQLGSVFIRQLLSPDKADQPVPVSFLLEVKQPYRQSKVKSQTFCEMKEYLDSLSLFAGRNLLVSSTACHVMKV